MDKTCYKSSYKIGNVNFMSISLASVGFAKCKPDFFWGPGIREHYLIHFVVEGSGFFIVNEIAYRVQKGEAFCIFPNTIVTYFPDPDDPWTYYWFGFNGCDAVMIMDKTDFTIENPRVGNFDLTTAKKYVMSIYSKRGNSFGDIIYMSGKLLELLALFVSKQYDFKVGASKETLLYAISFIKFSYTSQISIEDIARKVEISKSQLCRIFKTYLKCSPSQFLENYRIECATKLLKTTNLSMKVISNSVGYLDPLYFTRVFKKNMAMSPTEYKKRNKEDIIDHKK
ncbi:MAG: AraC family transcriptional regulator [Clostridia bacterium]